MSAHPPLTATLLAELQHALEQAGFTGETRFDAVTRRLFSTDASIYQIEPLGVAFPRTPDDLAAAVEVATSLGVPVLARGSGSSLAGQAIGPALILDCSRHLNHLLEIDPEEKTATVEPGLILTALNRQAAVHRLQFGPDPASAERATLGGSIANNATGAHSILYGMAGDHLLSAEVVLADGSLATFESLNLREVRSRYDEERSLLGGLYRAALHIREEHAESIRAAWPLTWRRVSGYSLNYLLPWSPTRPPQWEAASPGWNSAGMGTPLPYPPIPAGQLNLAPLLAGSEGTLAVIRKAKLQLVPLPLHTVLGVKAYDSIAAACDAVPGLLETAPSAIELIPRSLVSLARSVPAYARQLSFVGQLLPHGEDPAALLVLEYAGEAPGPLVQKAKALGEGTWLAETSEAQKQVWAVRKVGLGILMSRPGSLKPVSFIEDMAVPVELLGEFVREMERLLAEHNTQADFYAHASAGCLHIRPLLDLKSLKGTQDLRAIAEKAADLVIGLGGAVSSEHGDGLARSEWIERAYGKEVMAAFRELKKAADPRGLLNPGKILDAPQMDENLRYGQGYHAQGWDPVFSFSGGDLQTPVAGLAGAIEQCNGAGVCRKADGVMCPSFQASQDEMHSTRGRANLLRWMISARAPAYPIAETAVRQALDLCLACKGCKAECPSGVDMAKLKYEFTQRYYGIRGHKRPWRDYLFGFIDAVARLGRPMAFLVNPLLASSLFAWMGERLLGLSPERTFPRFAARPLQAQWRREKGRCVKEEIATGQKTTLAMTGQANEEVFFLSDAFTEYFFPEAGLAALRVLSRLGCRVTVLPVAGAGRTLISKGFLKEAKSHAQALVQALKHLDSGGQIPVVGVEPSEILTLRDEYLDFFPGDPYVTALAERAWMVDEFLVRPDATGQRRVQRYLDPAQAKEARTYLEGRVLLHEHCYQKAQSPAADGLPNGVQASVEMLKAAGYTVQLIDDGCCGMAGAFGYEKEHYNFSMLVGELALFPAIRKATLEDPTVILAAAGISCQSQIRDGIGREAIHPIQLMDSHP